MAKPYTISVRRRVLIELYQLFLNYPAGVITMLGTQEPRKMLRSVQRIATRLWEKGKDFQKKMQDLNEERVSVLQPFGTQEEKLREICQEKITLRPSDESWKKECEHYRDTALQDHEEDKEEALWKAGYFHKLFDFQHRDGMEFDEIELSKDLHETLVKCYEKYQDAKFDLEPEPAGDEKEKKPKTPKFVIKVRGSNPFGGVQEVPLELSRGAESEFEYAIGAYSDDGEEADLKLRISQIWDGDRQNDERTMAKIEARCGKYVPPEPAATV